MHSLRKYQGFIIYQTWADIEPFGTDKSIPYEGLIKKSAIYLPGTGVFPISYIFHLLYLVPIPPK